MRTPVAHADGVPGGNISDPIVHAVDVAKPAVVRIITVVPGQLTVNFTNGQSVTFPLTPQDGLNAYPLTLSGSGGFISTHGDILTADHVVNPPKSDLDPFLQQTAAPDIASYINQKLNPSQPVTADVVTQELASGQLQATSQYQQAQSRVYLSTDFTGPLTAPNFQSIPASQYANVDQIEQQSLTDQKDVAIIHVSGMDNMPMLQLGDSSSVQEQDQLTIIGFPGNGDVGTSATDLLTSSINQVLVSSIKTTDTGAPVIQVGGNVEQGDSGGPALDSKGQIVGIVSFGVADTNGSTSFLQASNSAKQLVQTAGIDTRPSTFQQAWSQAFSNYASQATGHWHKAAQEFQQIANQYPRFKSDNQFLQYATQQAKTEKVNQPSVNSPSASGANANSTLYILIGGIVLLIIVLGIGVLVISRRRRAPVAAVMPGYPQQNAGYSSYQGQPVQNPPAQSAYQAGQSMPGQSINLPGQSISPGQSAYQQRPAYQPQPAYGGHPGYPPVPTPSQSMVTPQQAYRPQQPYSSANAASMSPFGAPNMPSTPQPDSFASSPMRAAQANPSPGFQWQSWPCGHTNRSDAAFCGICGEPSPPQRPSARRYEQ